MDGPDPATPGFSRFRPESVSAGRGMLTRVGVGFIVLPVVLCAVVLSLPHYVRQGWWTVVFLGIIVVCLLMAAVMWLVPQLPRAAGMIMILLSDGELVLAAACLEDRGSARLVAVLLVPPTLFTGMFQPQRMLIVQAVVVAISSTVIMAMASDPVAVLLIHVVIVEMAAISPAFAVLSLREGLSRSLAAQRRLALVDPLTSLTNRRGLTEYAPVVVRAALAKGLPVAVLVADLDHFKRVNDTWGHRVGDEVLLTLAETVRACVASEDLVVRLGGEEIAVVAAISPARAASMAERIRAQVSQRLAVWRTTVSVGVAWAEPGDVAAESVVWDLVELADERLFAAKEAGRNCVALPA